MNQQPEDAHVRSRALDPAHSYICVAPAGSGKTELLTQRMLVLLARVKKPEEILAITFTRKAAAEMQDRVLGALRAAQGPEPQEAHKRQSWQLAKTALQADDHFGWQLIQSPHRLQVRTFDGLCASLVKALPLQAQMGVGVALSDDPDRLFALAAMNLMSELEKPGTVADGLALLLMHLDNQLPRLVELFVALLKSRAAWLPLIYDPTTELREHLETCLAQVREAHIARVTHLIPVDHQATLLALIAFAARNLPPGSDSCTVYCADLVNLPKADEEGLRQWQGIVSLLLTNSGSWRQRFTKNEGIPAKAEGVTNTELAAIKVRLSSLIDLFKTVEPLREALSEISRLPYARYPDQQWQILQALAQVLPRLVAHLQLVFGSEGELDYTEVSLRADQALGDDQDPTDLALHLDHRISHILVDEFQDTSTHQLQLVQKLTAGWQPGDGRTLFCVGDAMQSIYAFRNANVGLFLRCLGSSQPARGEFDKGEFDEDEAGVSTSIATQENWRPGQSYGHLGSTPLAPLRLTTNFRSDASIVEWINKHFEAAFPSAIDLNLGAVPFGKAVAYNPSNGAAVGTRGFLLAGEQIGGQRSANDRAGVIAEGDWLAKTIGQVLAADPAATIAILGRGRKQLNNVLPSLKAAGIAYRAVDLDSLASVAAVQDVWVLTRALLDTNDTIAWLSLLRAPWCGLRLADLLALREVPGISVLSQLTSVIKSDEAGTKIVDSDAISRLKSVFLVLSESLAERSRKSLVDWVKGCWLALGGAEGLNLADHNNVERFFDALAECDETTLIQRPERLQNLLAELYALPNHDAGNQIQVMTMHKSKGLEFDVVFLVGLASATGAPEAPLMRWHEQLFDNDSAGAKGIAHSDRAQAISWLLSPIGERGQDRDSLYDWLGYQQKKREHLEACRLLYVACTRAKKQLYLTAVFYQKEGGEFPAPGKGSLLSHIWPTVEMAFRQTAIKIEPLEHLNHNGGLDIADNLPNLRRLVTPRRYSKKLITMPGTEIHPSDLPSTTAAIISTAGQNFVQNSQPITDQSDSLARALGSITHEILEVIVPAEIKTFGEIRTIQKQWSPFFESWRQRLEQLLRSQSLSAERLSILREDLAAQIPVIVNHLDKVFSNQSPLCLALKGAREIHPECEINGPDENGDIREWRIDLWWRNNQGQVYLLDYKTALCPQTIAVDVFENSQRALYENGVKRYAKLLSQTLDELVIPVLYLIDTHSWLIIEE